MRDEFPYVEPVPGDLADLPSLVKALEHAQPDEVYNLGAISFVATQLQPGRADRQHHRARRAAHARGDPHGRRHPEQPDPLLPGVSSSEMFGKVRETPQTEMTPVPSALAVRLRQGVRSRHHGQLPRELRPVRLQRASCSTTRVLAAASSSSPARSPTPSARIKLGLQDELVLGNLDTKRDWGYAGDYVQGDVADAAAGRARRLRRRHRRDPQRSRNSSSLAFAEVGIDDWQRYVRQDPKFFRPAEVDLLIGDSTKARTKLGWEPEVDFPEPRQDDGRPRPRRSTAGPRSCTAPSI